MSDAVLVIGGGIAGIQASLDLAEMGKQVYLIEKTPSIGGRMAQLDKTFPTNDCSICILAPKMADCYDHPNTTVFTCSEVKEVTGSAGDFTVKVLKRARLVDEKKCTGCGACTEKCPAKAPDEFNVNLGTRRAAHLYFLQAVPRLALIDKNSCIRYTKGPKKDGSPRCGVCIEACEAGAIDFDQQDEEITLKVGAVIIAIGFDPYDPTSMTEYGYGRFKNVVTGMEYERLICASGPTGGHLHRLSDDHRDPKKIAFIQCVGSRDLHHNRYCAGVCCMHSTKEAILANEHDNDIHSYIFYIDVRASGKGFQNYVARAEKEYNVTYIRSRVAEITEDADQNPVIWYEDTSSQEVKSMTVDMVVLATCMVPREGVDSISEATKVDLTEYKFFKTSSMSPVDSTIPGIFACGYCQGPMDIPESVAQASAAAARAAEIVSSR
ncbi:MAG: CoB--CoM heterodisulfide reductase iron-sulfur subunit A family protein [Chloroflexota bacterium]|nr:CoB--CoM heterodisulfide reductase iron-sulfur subunit A family protein [Chloroflexota bacterium]